MTTRPSAGNLPHEVSSFIGRREEVFEVRRLLAASRVVTLTGMGGVGKSRLAVRVADRLRRSFPDGTWHVDLSGLDDPVLLPQTFARALGVTDQSIRDPLAALIAHLARRRLLLVVDDCEHMLPACASLIAELLRAVPGLRLLATSRETLGIVGEHVFPVAPLAAPDPDGEPSSAVLGIADASRYPAVALFVERARAVRPGFALTQENVQIVCRVCHRLDGLPLAIELASARLRSLGLEDLERRLDDRFALLTSPTSAGLPRHRALRTATDGSFDMCSTAEQLLWKLASVFAGPFHLEAAEFVCVTGGLSKGDVLDALGGLIDKSVVIAEEAQGRVQYRMLETVRLYGDERLRNAGTDGKAGTDGSGGHHVEHTALQRRHRDFYVELTEHLNIDWFGPRQVQWSTRMHAELPNLRAALGLSMADPTGAPVGLRLAGALQYFWWGCGEAREGRLWLERALRVAPTPTPEWVRAMTSYCRLLNVQGNPHAAVQPGRHCVELARQVGDAFLLVEALVVTGLNLASCGAPTEAIPMLDEALALARELPQRPHALASATLYRSVSALMTGDADRARERLEECQALCRRHGDLLYLGYALDTSVLVALMAGKADEARELAHEAVLVHQSLRDRVGLTIALESLAWIAGAARDHRRAARLLGATEAQVRRVGGSPMRIEPFSITHHDCAAATRAALGDTDYKAQFQLGAEHGSGDLIVRHGTAVHHGKAAVLAAGHGPDLSELTRREVDVAALIAEGLSNRDIADRLVIAQRTAESHVERIMVKLGFTSRAQVAVWYAQRADRKPQSLDPAPRRLS